MNSVIEIGDSGNISNERVFVKEKFPWVTIFKEVKTKIRTVVICVKEKSSLISKGKKVYFFFFSFLF
jgi:hypothetical protein